MTTRPAGAPDEAAASSSTPLLRALHAAAAAEPVTDPTTQRQLLRPRPVIADLTDRPPGPTLLAELTAALGAANDPAGEVVLSQREWLELAVAADRCIAHTHSLQLATIAALDRAALAARPLTATRRDTRRSAADELAPALKIAPGTASALVTLARRLEELPLAEDAFAAGQMTLAQLRVLIAALRALPEVHHPQLEALAVRKAASMTRARLAAAVDQAALDADPAYAARRAAQGVTERDVRLVPSPVPGCARIVADLERLDAAAVWQVLNAVARTAKDESTTTSKDDGEGDCGDVGLDAEDGEPTQEERTLAQLRADALVSVLVGTFAPTASQQQAGRVAAPGTVPGATDEDADGDDADGDDPDLPEDTRGTVHIPTPAQRAHLAEVHVVVLADDLDDDPGDDLGDDRDPGEDPAEGPPDGPEGGLWDQADDSDDHDDPAGEETRDGNGPGPRPDGHGVSFRPPRPGPARRGCAPHLRPQAGPGPGSPAPALPRRRPPRRDTPSRRSGAGTFGSVPGIGRITPTVMHDVLARAPWRRLVADPATGTLRTRSRWRLPPPRPGAGHPIAG